MADKKIKSGKTYIVFVGIGLFLFMLTSLFLMSQSLQNSELFDRYYLILFTFNTLGLLTLIFLIAINFRRLLNQKKNKTLGSRMTARMVLLFSILSVTPVLVVYYFSLDFLNRGIDSWFDLRVEQALDDSLQLSRLALDVRMRELLQSTEKAAIELSNFNDALLPLEIDRLLSDIDANELTLINLRGAIIAASSISTSGLVPDLPADNILSQIKQGNNYIGLDVIKESDLFIRAVVNIPVTDIEKDPRILQALFPISERMNQLTESVQSSYIKYKELSYLRHQLKVSFIIILTLVLLFSIFSAVWAAFYSASNLSAPVKNLAEGTRAIAEGNYNTRLPVHSNDELGYLVSSFNEMTDKIDQARKTAHQSQVEAEEQKSYLETVLSSLSSGVLVIDSEQRIEKINESATLILQIDAEEVNQTKLQLLCDDKSRLFSFYECIKTHIDEQEHEWREQITIINQSDEQFLVISGTTLTSIENVLTGYVIVFDEITALIKGQRDAAYSEMARRLAHEIKNPLTPIQLAAERLRHKYLSKLDHNDADTMERMTNTIIQQVDTMKEMVNSFSDYARAPEFSPTTLDITELVKEVVDLFGNLEFGNLISLNIADNLPRIVGDEKKFRQVLNNLLRNAVDANSTGDDNSLSIDVLPIMTDEKVFLEIRITDNGSGIQEDVANKLFEPYITTKQKGTGLGLSIVKKIIDEHKGRVWLENNKEAGASAIIQLPAAESIDEFKQLSSI